MEESLNFVENIVEEDILNNVFKSGIVTRFPPEPNGYIHLGHVKSICLNFELALKYNGTINLRFDDTNPDRENFEFINSIKDDILWLGYKWDNEFYASDYFETLYKLAKDLVKNDLAYVDDSSFEEIGKQRGLVNTTGLANKFRNRSINENLELLEAMKLGNFAEGEKVLRAKIDMESLNIHMRDPIIYRIKHKAHYRTGSKWHIYPMYDFAHGQSDAIEGVTHSTCTLEFESHRPLYEWFINKLELFPSKQIEFARLNLGYTIMSKRKLLKLIELNLVDGWDDPRLPTVAGLRRRGYTPQSLKKFCKLIGVTKRDSISDYGLLEFCAREHLNVIAERRIAVLKPLKLVITNFEETKVESIRIENMPGNESRGHRELFLSRELWIEQDDFRESSDKNYFRLKLGGSVRLKGTYIVTCHNIIKDESDNILEIHCKYHPDGKTDAHKNNIKVKSTIHWLSTRFAVPAKIQLYNKLFNIEDPGSLGEDFIDHFNIKSIQMLENAFVEPSLAEHEYSDTHFQFLRQGYFIKDKYSTAESLIFNRTVDLKERMNNEK